MGEELFQEFGLGDEEKEGALSKDDRETFNPQKDESYRISLAWWPTLVTPAGSPVKYDMDAARPRVLRTQTLYGGQGIGYALYKGPEYARLMNKEPEDRIATVVVSWPIFRKGPKAGKTDPELFRAGRYEVLPWVFSKHKYQQISRAHNTKPLGMGDLRVTCTNAQFKHLEMSSYDENYLRKIMESKPDVFADIRERIETVSKSLKKLLGKDYTLDELREKLGVSGGGGGGSSEDVPMSSTADFDDVLGDILK
jgi:hypothetical protein